MFKGFILALQFLTRISVKKDIEATNEEFSASAIFFPAVGLLIGGIQVLLFLALDGVFFPSITALFLLLAPIALTGAFHLEALSDMADGFLSGRDREGILRIMKDSHVGTMGMIATVALILTRYVLLNEIIQLLNTPVIVGVLLFVPGLSRWGMVIGAGISQYARSEPGLGRIFTEGVRKRHILISGLVPAAAAIAYLRFAGALCVIVSILAAVAISRISKRKINGVTGDVLGSINEITDVILLFVMLALDRF